MAKRRYYVSCLNCQTRMVRTGKKIKEYGNPHGSYFYQRGYKCPGCGLVIGYSESRNLICRGEV